MTTPAAPGDTHHTNQHPRWPDDTPILVGEAVTVHAGRDHAWDGEIHSITGRMYVPVVVEPTDVDLQMRPVHPDDLTRIAPSPIEEAEALGPDNGFGHDDCDPADVPETDGRPQLDPDRPDRVLTRTVEHTTTSPRPWWPPTANPQEPTP